MGTSTLTTDAVAASGMLGFLGGMLATFGIIAFIIWILLVIAQWKIFEKAGEAGWKSLIPIYSTYILCRIIDINFWIYAFAIPVVLALISSLTANDPQSALYIISTLLTSLYTIFFFIWTSIRLGKAFKKSGLFIAGLIFFPNIFMLILGFGASKYHKK